MPIVKNRSTIYGMEITDVIGANLKPYKAKEVQLSKETERSL